MLRERLVTWETAPSLEREHSRRLDECERALAALALMSSEVLDPTYPGGFGFLGEDTLG